MFDPILLKWPNGIRVGNKYFNLSLYFCKCLKIINIDSGNIKRLTQEIKIKREA